MALVNDGCEPMQFLSYTEDDVRSIPLKELYLRTCQQLGIRKPNQIILDQLPSQVGEHHRLITLSCANTYLGCKGLVSMCPVIEVCYRLTHLNVKGVGMKADAAKTLLKVLTVHPGIRCLNISSNDLGTAVATQLLGMLQKHRRVYDVNFEKILVIEALKKKIVKQLELNHSVMNQFSIPLIPEDSDDAEMVKKRQAEAEEKARVQREVQHKKEQSERIPPWGPAALLEVSECLWKHREHMEDVFCVFDKGTRNPLIPPAHFQRAMRILGINTLQHDVVRCTDFCEMFGAWHRAEDEVNYVTIVNTLRIHVEFQPPSYPVVKLKEEEQGEDGTGNGEKEGDNTKHMEPKRNGIKCHVLVLSKQPHNTNKIWLTMIPENTRHKNEATPKVRRGKGG